MQSWKNNNCLNILKESTPSVIRCGEYGENIPSYKIVNIINGNNQLVRIPKLPFDIDDGSLSNVFMDNLGNIIKLTKHSVNNIILNNHTASTKKAALDSIKTHGYKNRYKDPSAILLKDPTGEYYIVHKDFMIDVSYVENFWFKVGYEYVSKSPNSPKLSDINEYIINK